MWPLSSFARISVYPAWMASNKTSWIKIYCSSTWTMMFLSHRNDITYPNTSTVFSAAIRCSMASTTINVPVLPTPALQWTTWKNMWKEFKKQLWENHSGHWKKNGKTYVVTTTLPLFLFPGKSPCSHLFNYSSPSQPFLVTSRNASRALRDDTIFLSDKPVTPTTPLTPSHCYVPLVALSTGTYKSTSRKKRIFSFRTHKLKWPLN